MDVTTTAKYVRGSTLKLRVVSESIRRLNAGEAAEKLAFMHKGAAKTLLAVINTAIADAVTTFKLDKQKLYIKAIDIGGAPKIKRFRPVARGTAHPYIKHLSHIKVTLEEKEIKPVSKEIKREESVAKVNVKSEKSKVKSTVESKKS